MKKYYTTAHVFHILEQRGVLWFASAAVGLAILYGLLVSFSITNVIVRELAQKAATDLEGQLISLEFNYLSARSAVSEERAAELGLVHVPEKTYVARVRETRVATLSE